MERKSRALLAWYDAHGRDLPWRRDPQPYRVWVSEIMSQQTRIAAALPYYQNWMLKFPDVSVLAAADEDVVLKAWEGLGYYSRARNLHKAANVVMEDYGGKIPSNSQELRMLPGIGPYTAAAIASIAYGERVAAVDGNALRVIARVFGVSLDIGSREGRQKIEALLLAILPQERPGDGNQAVMDLGSSHCLPKQSRCEGCPLETHCAAHAAGWEEALPVKQPKKGQRVEHRALALVTDGRGAYLLRRRTERLLHNLWEFPGELLDGPDAVPSWRILTDLGLRIDEEGDGPQAEHVFTHIRWKMRGYWLQSAVAPLPEGFAWVRGEDMKDFAIPTAMRAFLQAVLAKGVTK